MTAMNRVLLFGGSTAFEALRRTLITPEGHCPGPGGRP
jgi:hypothetical protein